MIIRFIIVLIFAYLSFFILMKLWLYYLTKPHRIKRDNGDLIDAVDLASVTPDCNSTETSSSGIFGGGKSGGGGASGSWDQSDDVTTSLSEGINLAPESIGKTAVETAGETASGLAEEGGLLLLPLIALLIIIFGSGVYLIYQAPAIISETAFEVILATSLMKKTRTIDKPDWVGSVFRATWPAFLFTLLVPVILGFVATSYCPQATKLTEVVRICF